MSWKLPDFRAQGHFLVWAVRAPRKIRNSRTLSIKIKHFVAHGQSGFGTVSPKVLLADTKDSLEKRSGLLNREAFRIAIQAGQHVQIVCNFRWSGPYLSHRRSRPVCTCFGFFVLTSSARNWLVDRATQLHWSFMLERLSRKSSGIVGEIPHQRNFLP